ncbi:beta-ketoacyl reductase [Photorhabdus luminescens]|uniref:beta-ketoacyl reductase n=1 Tax=Photorhabdus luminescens TaxID=29488 RepID=UPI0030DA8DDD
MSSNQSGRLIHLPVYAFAEQEFTKLRDRLVRGRTPQIKSPDIKQNILYQPVWYRSSCDNIEKITHEGQVYALTTRRGADSNRALVDNVLPTRNVIFVDEVDKLPPLNLTGSCSFVLIPNAEDFVCDPIAHYLEWLVCIKEILSIKSLAASRFILLTPQIENVLGYEATDAAISLLKGLIQSINYEHQEHYGYQIDISFDELAKDNSTQSLFRHLVSSDINHRLAIRHNQIWLPEFKVLPNKKVETHQQCNGLHERCLVLISGGLGGIALQLSQSLAQHYKARIVLASRTAIPERSQWASIKENKQQSALIKQVECLEQIEQLGGEVILRQLDVTDKTQLFDTLQCLENDYGAINMVIHSAGSDAGALIMQPDISSHRKIMTAKVEGTMNLLSYFEEKPLSSMVLCSSLLSYSGAPGQSAYVAANAFLDAIADRRDLKFKVYSLAWDRWLEVGMALRNMKIDASTAGLTNQQGEAVFLQALSQATQQRLLVSVIPIEERLNRLEKEKASTLAETKSGIVDKNISIKQVISEEVQHQLGLSEIDEHCSFFALGATSLDIVQINERLKQRICHDIPISMMFTYSTVSKLENAVASKLNNTQESEVASLQPRTSASQLAKQRMKNKRVKKSVNYAA